jgi:hypothetical protein
VQALVEGVLVVHVGLAVFGALGARVVADLDAVVLGAQALIATRAERRGAIADRLRRAVFREGPGAWRSRTRAHVTEAAVDILGDVPIKSDAVLIGQALALLSVFGGVQAETDAGSVGVAQRERRGRTAKQVCTEGKRAGSRIYGQPSRLSRTSSRLLVIEIVIVVRVSNIFVESSISTPSNLTDGRSV